MPRAMFAPADLDELLDALREGAVVKTTQYGGRYATTCSFRDGAFHVERFDEGLTETFRYDADAMRELIARADDRHVRIDRVRFR